MTITDEMVEKAYSALDDDPFHSMKAALSAVAPLIRSAALDEAARVADGNVDLAYSSMSDGLGGSLLEQTAAAIRSLKDKDTRTPTEGDLL